MIDILGYLRENSFDKIDGPQYYRAYLPLREVGQQADDIQVTLASLEEAATHGDDDPWWNRDIFMMSRIYHEGKCRAYVDEIHRRGGVLVLDSDDDLTETFKLVSGHGPEFCDVLGMVDYVTVSTQPLADLFGLWTQRPPVVLRNCVDVNWMQTVTANARRLVQDQLTIGFTGSPTHWGDWRLPAVPYANILREYAGTVRGVLHGETPRYLKHAADNLIKIAGVPMAIYPVVLKQFDVVLCAVDVNDEFNAGKSAVKALECMALGIVPICSRFGPYLDLAAQGAPLVVIEEESRAGWYEAMRGVIEETELTEQLSTEGPPWVASHRDMVKGGYKQWADFYRSIK